MVHLHNCENFTWTVKLVFISWSKQGVLNIPLNAHLSPISPSKITWDKNASISTFPVSFTLVCVVYFYLFSSSCYCIKSYVGVLLKYLQAKVIFIIMIITIIINDIVISIIINVIIMIITMSSESLFRLILPNFLSEFLRSFPPTSEEGYSRWEGVSKPR